MIQYGLRRVLLSIPVLFAILIITFTLGFYGPGDPLTIFFGEYMPNPEIAARLRVIYGLDKPFWHQFGVYTGVVRDRKGQYKGLLQGDLGVSLRTHRAVSEAVVRTMPISAQLGLATAVVLAVVGVPLGVLAASKQNTWIDYWIVAISISVRSVPVFVLAPLVLIIIVLQFGIMNTPIGWHGIFSQQAIIPVLLMATGPLLVVVRQTRGGVLEVFGQGYVRTARSKGLRERSVITRHVLKNALTPVMTSMGLILGGLLTGALFVELIFGIPGFAGYAISSFQTRDYPAIMATTLIGAVLIIGSNLLVDLLYGVLDPRVRYV